MKHFCGIFFVAYCREEHICWVDYQKFLHNFAAAAAAAAVVVVVVLNGCPTVVSDDRVAEALEAKQSCNFLPPGQRTPIGRSPGARSPRAVATATARFLSVGHRRLARRHQLIDGHFSTAISQHWRDFLFSFFFKQHTGAGTGELRGKSTALVVGVDNSGTDRGEVARESGLRLKPALRPKRCQRVDISTVTSSLQRRHFQKEFFFSFSFLPFLPRLCYLV